MLLLLPPAAARQSAAQRFSGAERFRLPDLRSILREGFSPTLRLMPPLAAISRR